MIIRVLFVVVALIGVLALVNYMPPMVDYSMGSWRDFDQENFDVTSMTGSVTVTQNKVPYTKKGHWSNHAFYCDSGLDAPGEAAAVRETSDQIAEVQMKYFNPSDTKVYDCVKTMRGYFDPHPYPTSQTPNLVITYPPPKGLFQVGMLEADLEFIPWQNKGADVIDNPTGRQVQIYHYRSDDPNLPELQVSVTKGIVTEVTGGAEGQSGPSWFDTHPADTTEKPIPSNAKRPSDSGWVMWVLNWFFGK